MKRYLLPVSLLFFLCACSSPDLDGWVEPSSASDAVRFNALVSCLGETLLPSVLLNENAFTVVDYFGEPASLGRSDLGASRLQDPWCLLTVDVKGYPTDTAYNKLKNLLDTHPNVLLRILSPESQDYAQDRGIRSFDPDCDDLAAMDAEASAALPVSVNSLRSRLGVHSAGLTGEGVTVAVFDGGTGQPKAFRAASRAAGFSRNFLSSDYPSASKSRHDIRDRFDCSQTPYVDGHGSLVTEIISSVAPGANQIMFKVCDDNGHCPSSSIAKALLYMSNGYANFPKIDIVNMSFGGNFAQDELLWALLERTMGMNWETLFVASTGNDPIAPFHYPADFYDLHHGIIPVAAAKAVTKDGVALEPVWQLADFNTKSILQRRSDRTLAAPGVRLQVGRGNPGGVSGTSFAAPVVSAVAAIERQSHPQHNMTAYSLHANLLSSAKTLGDFKFVHLGD